MSLALKVFFRWPRGQYTACKRLFISFFHLKHRPIVREPDFDWPIRMGQPEAEDS